MSQLQKPQAKKKPQGKAQAQAPAAAAAAPARGGRRVREESSDDDSEEDEDDEIGLTAEQNQRATITPITAASTAAAAKKSAAAKKAAKPAAGAAPAAAAGSKKRKAKDDAEEAEAGDDSGDDDDDPNALIDVEFGIYDPRPVDYLTLKMLLKDFVPVASASSSSSSANKKKKAKKGKRAAAAAAAAAANSDSDDDDDEDAEAVASAALTPLANPDFALHELCDTLVSQVCAGSMVKGEGTEEPLGFLSALNMSWQAAHGLCEDGRTKLSWPSQLRSYILRHTPSGSPRATMEAALADPATGLVIQQRLLNVPPQIVPQLHQCLLDDLEWARSNAVPPSPAKPSPEDIANYRASFKFKQILLIGRTFRPPAGSKRQAKLDVVSAAGMQQFTSPFASKKKQKKAAASAAAAAAAAAPTADLPEFEWLRFEEELYARESTLQFTFACPFTAEDAAAGRLPQSCVVMLLPASKMPAIVQELHAMAAMV